MRIEEVSKLYRVCESYVNVLCEGWESRYDEMLCNEECKYVSEMKSVLLYYEKGEMKKVYKSKNGPLLKRIKKVLELESESESEKDEMTESEMLSYLCEFKTINLEMGMFKEYFHEL